MATYKTPGVYVEEISTLPASVAQVETAIPAFIGWTEKAELNGKSLKNVPTRIKSMVEFKELFGGEASNPGTTVVLNGSNDVESVSMEPQYYLFNSLKLFYANGGGPCYIVSCGSYDDAYSGGNMRFGDYDDPDSSMGLASGLKKVEKVDEVTLLVFPDAVLLPGTKLYDLQKLALGQCEKLKDRFVVMDLLEQRDLNNDLVVDDRDWSAGVDEFRNNIGTSNLKYGAAYTPYVKASIDVKVLFRDLTIEKPANTTIQLDTLTNNADIQALVNTLRNAVADYDKVSGGYSGTVLGISDLAAAFGSIQNRWDSLVAAVNGSLTGLSAAKETALINAFKFLVDISEVVEDWNDIAQGLAASGQLAADLDLQITGTFAPGLTNLLAWALGAEHATDGLNYTNFRTSVTTGSLVELVAGPANPWGINPAPAANTDPYDSLAALPGGENARILSIMDELNEMFQAFNGAVNGIYMGAALYETNAQDALYSGYPIYKKIQDSVASASVILPPSGAIVGQYATVDRTRGVWKAPANVSINGITGLTYQIDNDDNDNLNVDPTAGKSVNAIRAFTGKGILIWGARTLAGNDNEWRYVPVRRLYIMVEESIKKATEFVVFEPNDANTWVRVRGMITSYLTELWRQGALAGSKPSQAFFVNVGLGETMTPQDILEGRLIIEIGMAAVRPAEFIILKFSHKLQEA